MQKIKLENVSFNKLKEFTSLSDKKNTTIKGKFTLTDEYELITKDEGDSMTNKELAKLMMNEFVKLWDALDKVIKVNNLKSYK